MSDQRNYLSTYILGRPPWFNKDGGVRKEPFFIGISGGSASGKTTVATNIIKQLDVQWVCVQGVPFYFSYFKLLVYEKIMIFRPLKWAYT